MGTGWASWEASKTGTGRVGAGAPCTYQDALFEATRMQLQPSGAAPMRTMADTPWRQRARPEAVAPVGSR
jgi:hypothetical protein